jgi:hypothetical protein
MVKIARTAKPVLVVVQEEEAENEEVEEDADGSVPAVPFAQNDPPALVLVEYSEAQRKKSWTISNRPIDKNDACSLY